MKRKCIFILGFILLLFLFFNVSESKASFDFTGADSNYHSILDIPEDVGDRYFITFTDNTYYLCYPGSKYLNSNNLIFRVTQNKLGFSVNTLTSWATLSYKSYNINTDTSWIQGYVDKPDLPNQNDNVIYSTQDIVYSDNGDIFFNASFQVKMNYIEEENMYQACTNFFDMSEFDNLACYISSDNSTWNNMLVGEDTVNNQFEFYYNIIENGTYYIKLVYLDTLKETVVTVTADKIEGQDISLNLHLSTTENTTDPIYILSNKYYYEGAYDATEDFLNNYDIDIAYGLESPYQFSPFSIEGTDENGTFRQYQYKIVANGIYQAKILNFNTGEISYEIFNVKNIGYKNKYGEDVYYDNYNENGEFDPTPILFLEYVDTTTVRIRTQPFIFNELMYLECYFSSDNENYEKVNNIYKYSVDTGNSSYDYNTGEKQSIQDFYYFYYDVQVDGTYYFKFYNIDLKKYTVGSIEVDINQFLINNVDNIDKYPDRFVIWVEEHFGIIVYPTRFLFNFFGRLLTINYSEPILSIPELKEPFSGYTILNKIEFNFNSLLENANIRIVHNLYLIFMDVAIIYMIIRLAGDIFEEVFKE